MPPQQVMLADTPESLGEAIAAIGDLDPVGVDVERADWDRYYRAAALIQIGGDGRVAVVDPLRLDDLTPLGALLEGRQVVFHAVENDLGPLEALGLRITSVQDTAIAAALLGLPTGLETLLRDLLDVELAGDKSAMQRSDWEHRPLTAEMVAYAAGDVADLPALWAELERRLRAADRWAWYEEELRAALAQPPVEERRDWTRVKGLGRAQPEVRARARQLWDVREALARATNTAPGRILGDRVLLDLAASPPASVRELGRRGMRRQAIRQFGQAVITALQNGSGDPEPIRRPGRATTEADRQLADQLRLIRADRAEALGIDAGVLCPSRTLLAAILAEPTTPQELRAALGLRSWQWQQIGADFCRALGITWPADDEEEERG